MTKKVDTSIPVSEVAAEWFKNPKFVRAYEALEEEFAEEERRIKARKAEAVARLARMRAAKAKRAASAQPGKTQHPQLVAGE